MAGTDFNFTSEHVQKEIENGEYISTESTVLLAGPSQLTFTEGINEQGSAKYPLFPIGLVGSFSFDQTRDVNRLYEVGSKRAYFIPNRLRGDFTMARTLFYGPSLMRLLYALAPIETAGKWGNKLKDNENNTPRSLKPNGVASSLSWRHPTRPRHGPRSTCIGLKRLLVRMVRRRWICPFRAICGEARQSLRSITTTLDPLPQ